MTDSIKPKTDKKENSRKKTVFSCMDGFFGTKENKPIKLSFIGSNKVVIRGPADFKLKFGFSLKIHALNVKCSHHAVFQD